VAEYIPFGANQIVQVSGKGDSLGSENHDAFAAIRQRCTTMVVTAYLMRVSMDVAFCWLLLPLQLNNNLGSTERVQGGFISPVIDNDSAGTSVEMSPELTSVDILDYTLTNHINFEADINFSEDSGVIQVETFGVSLNAEGTCFYGMQIEAVMDRIKDNISLDHLSRLLVDVQQDSSAIVDSIVSGYQRDLLQLIFLGDASNRNKINLIIANEITPHLTAEEYMDEGEYENELRQVIGDTKAAYDISEHDTLIFGAGGLLVAGPNSRHHEPLLCAYLQFITIDIFVQNYFSRLWILNDGKSSKGINTHPTTTMMMRSRIIFFPCFFYRYGHHKSYHRREYIRSKSVRKDSIPHYSSCQGYYSP